MREVMSVRLDGTNAETTNAPDVNSSTAMVCLRDPSHKRRIESMGMDKGHFRWSHRFSLEEQEPECPLEGDIKIGEHDIC